MGHFPPADSRSFLFFANRSRRRSIIALRASSTSWSRASSLSGLTVGGLSLTSGFTYLWGGSSPTTDAAGKASILVWPSNTTDSFTMTPPSGSDLNSVSLKFHPRS